MMVEKEDLGLSLSLSSAAAAFAAVDRVPLKLNLASSSSPSPSTLPFLLKPQWSDLMASAAERRSAEMPLLRGIDVNRAPAAERESEEEAGASSPNSTLSSLSGNKRGEREREPATSGGGEELDVERASSRGISDEEDGGDGSRKKLRLSKDQSAILEETFKAHNTLNPKQKLALAKQLNLRPRQVEVWFQNRRARTKLKQTEVDCEFLKRCCESLTEENRRLQKEVQELRALKLSPQFYMHATPPTTLTMCPSCERVSNSSAAAAAAAAAPPAVPPPSPSTLSDQQQHLLHLRRPVPIAPAAPWAPVALRPSFLDAPPQRS